MTTEEMVIRILDEYCIIASCGDGLGNYNPKEYICSDGISKNDKECLLCKKVSECGAREKSYNSATTYQK